MKNSISIILAGILSFSSAKSFCQISRKIDRYLDSIKQTQVIPGFSVTVVYKKQILFSKGYGVEKLGATKPFRPTTVSSIGSLTKSFTALAILQLVEKGKIALDKPVVSYIPWFTTANKDKSDHITVRMLINNTSGLYTNSSLPMFDISEKALEKLTRNLESVYLTREPGTAYEYSNTAFSVAGFLVSKISGMSYAAYLQKEIFQPLEMRYTSTDPNQLKQLHPLEGHFFGIDRGIAVNQDQALLSGEYIPAGSLMNSCTMDISHYLIALTNGGIYNGTRIISENSIQLMWHGDVSFPGLSKEDGGDGRPFQYGLGWMISNIEGRVIIHHGGSTGKMSSFTMIDQAHELSAVILMNIDLTFINKYAYATQFNILNNVLRLAAGGQSSQFGLPVIKDITQNSYEIPDQWKDRYCGLYINENGGGDPWVYYGVDLRIFKRPDGQLTGMVFRGDQMVNQFIVDFISESQAITRNIAQPGTIHFQLNPAGTISGAFYNNIEFLFEDQKANNEPFQELGFDDIKVDLRLPESWKMDKNQGGWIATAKDGQSHLLIYCDQDLVIQSSTLKQQASWTAYSVKARGGQFLENLGKYSWSMRSFLLYTKDKIQQAEWLQTVVNKVHVSLLLITPEGDLTNQIQQLLNPILFSLKLEKQLKSSKKADIN